MQKEQPQNRWTPPRKPQVVLSLLVIGLNAFDGYATLLACRTKGAEELNPVMAALLAIGPGAFVAAKTLWIVLAMLFLAWGLRHPKVRDSLRKAGWGALIAICAVYSLLCGWHVLIMTGMISPPEIGGMRQQSPACIQNQNRPH